MPGSYKDTDRYPDLDLSPVFDAPTDVYPVVFCDTEGEALHFIAVMNRYHYDYCKNAWTFPETRFNNYRDGGVGYRIVRSSHRIQFCSQDYYRTEVDEKMTNYLIVPFSDLLVQADFSESDMSLEMLMGACNDD